MAKRQGGTKLGTRTQNALAAASRNTPRRRGPGGAKAPTQKGGGAYPLGQQSFVPKKTGKRITGKR